MDARLKINAALKGMRERYIAGEIDRDMVRSISSRAQHLMRRYFYLRTRRRSGAMDHTGLALNMLDRLETIIASGGTIMAVDTGFEARAGSPVEDVGITVANDPFGLRTVLLVDTAAIHRHPDPAQRTSRNPLNIYREGRFNEEIYRLPIGHMKRQVATSLENAVLVIFHGAACDQEKLGITVHPGRLIDTAVIGRLWTGARVQPGLAWLCERYGIDSTGHHNSANDSRFTWEVARAMLADPSLPGLRERHRMRQERNAAYRRWMMWPTRKPGAEAAWGDWKALNEAAERVNTGDLGLRHPAASGRRHRRAAKRAERRRRDALIEAHHVANH